MLQRTGSGTPFDRAITWRALSGLLLVQVCFAWLMLRSQQAGLFSVELGTVLLVAAQFTMCAALLYVAAKGLRKHVQERSATLEESNRELAEIAAIDGLTGIANRRSFDEALKIEWRRAGRAGVPLSLAMIDIDDFKPYNDAHGHLRGDECLKSIAAFLKANLNRAGDLVARYGGDEFVAILPAMDATAAAAFLETLRHRVEQLGIAADPEGSRPVTISAGVASARPRSGEPADTIVAAADRALYQAKQDGKNAVRAEPRPQPDSPPNPVVAVSGTGAEVLIVDDEPELREGLQLLLAEHGYSARTAENGAEALGLLRKGPLPSLILLDLAMPVMSGWDFVAELERDPELRDIPIAIMTAFDQSRVRHPAPRSSAGTLLKPCEPAQLLAILEKYCPSDAVRATAG